jgi:hypothetical protein
MSKLHFQETFSPFCYAVRCDSSIIGSVSLCVTTKPDMQPYSIIGKYTCQLCGYQTLQKIRLKLSENNSISRLWMKIANLIIRQKSLHMGQQSSIYYTLKDLRKVTSLVIRALFSFKWALFTHHQMSFRIFELDNLSMFDISKLT